MQTVLIASYGRYCSVYSIISIESFLHYYSGLGFLSKVALVLNEHSKNEFFKKVVCVGVGIGVYVYRDVCAEGCDCVCVST